MLIYGFFFSLHPPPLAAEEVVRAMRETPPLPPNTREGAELKTSRRVGRNRRATLSVTPPDT